MNISIRTARLDDLPALLDLYIHLNRDNAVLPDQEHLQQVWEQVLQANSLTCYVAEVEERLVGSCVLAVLPNLSHGARPFGVIENVVTHEEYRRQGIGKRLMRHVLQEAWNRNCYKVMLLSGAWRVEAHSFYEQLGFTKHSKVGFVATPESASWS